MTRTHVDKPYHLPTFLVGLALLATAEVRAQFAMNSEGANPNAALLLAGNTLYGTTAAAGNAGVGTLFALDRTDSGNGLRVLHTFTGGIDGANPWAGLILSGGTLYGTAYSGGAWHQGTVFAVNTNGSDFTTLYSFTGASDGGNPIGGLILTNNSLCGTTQQGGSSGNGTVFKISFAPQLTTALAKTNLVVSWPTTYAGFDYTGFSLRSTPTLQPLALWTTVLAGAAVVNRQMTVTNAVPGPQQFFRLETGVPGTGHL